MYVEIITYRESGQGTVIDSEIYTQVKNLSFAPDVDVTGNSLPIPGFEADIITTDDLHEADEAALYDDLDQIWAQYELTYAERVDANTVHVKAQSVLWHLEHVEMGEVMYEGVAASVVVATLFQGASNRYSLDEDLENVSITGFCPAQTARERLAWLCLVLDAYVDDTFTATCEIKPVDENGGLVPLQRTFWRPTVNYDEWVTAVRVTAYTFHRGTEAELKNSDTYAFPLPWIAQEQTLTLTNPDVPEGTPTNIKEIEGVYLVNTSNIGSILARMAKYWFKRVTVDLDCINNREYKPGQAVTVYTDEETLVRGYIQSAAFRFGVQARSTLKLIGAEYRDGAKLTVNYLYLGGRIGRDVYFLPVGYGYSIENPYLDRTYNKRRYVYRPQAEAATGTIVDGDNVDDQSYDLALDYYRQTLAVYYVDGIEAESSGGETIGVIE